MQASPNHRGRNRFVLPFLLCASLLAVPVWAAGLPGELDASFDGDGVALTAGGSFFRDVIIQPDGKAVVLGEATTSEGGSIWLIRRYTTSGALDTTFGSGGETRPFGDNGGFYGPMDLALDAAGRVIAVGVGVQEVEVVSGKGKHKTTTIELQAGAVAIRLETSGSLDTGFGTDGIVQLDIPDLGSVRARAVAVLASGRVVVAGAGVLPGAKKKGRGGGSTTPNVVTFITRLNANGATDSSFGTDGVSTNDVGDIHYGAIGVQSDGGIVLGGDTDDDSLVNGWALQRYEANGAVDTSFGTVGTPGFSYWMSRLVIDDQDRIVVGGYALNTTLGDGDGVVVRYSASGSIDGSFGSSGVVFANLSVRNESRTGLCVQADGKILLGGYTLPTDADYDAYVIRFTSAGALDTGFGSGGFAEALPLSEPHLGMALALAPDGSIVQCGIYETRTSTTTTRDSYVARWLGDG